MHCGGKHGRRIEIVEHGIEPVHGAATYLHPECDEAFLRQRPDAIIRPPTVRDRTSPGGTFTGDDGIPF